MLTRIRIENFRSIGYCDLALGPLNFLIGPNGVGKTNFVDALRFCRDCLANNPDQAFSWRRSNFQLLRHLPANQHEEISIRIDFDLSGLGSGFYEFRLGPASPRGFAVVFESCRVGEHYFKFNGGALEATFSSAPPTSPVRLLLANASGLQPFQRVYDALTSLEFYAPDTQRIRMDTGDTGSETRLEADCGNLALIFDHLPDASRASVVARLLRIVPGLKDVDIFRARDRRFLLFKHFAAEFFANEMSEGTLRAMAILVATFQLDVRAGRMPLIAFEDPETGVHPGAVGVLLEAIREASRFTQVFVTSQSADLLDDRGIPIDSLLAVEMREGATFIGPVASASREALRSGLFTAGELMRGTTVEPELAAAIRRP